MSRILAIETSPRNGSVALAESGVVVASRVLPSDMRSAQSLAPEVQEMLAQQGWQPSDLNGVGVTIGPGSFTGVRVGVTFAKVFCYAAKIPVIGLTTLEVLAHQAGARGLLDVVLDAQRSELFHQRFEVAASGAGALGEPHVVAAQTWLQEIAAETALNVTGAALTKLRAQLPPNVAACEEKRWEPSADAVAQLTHRELERGRRDDLWKLSPVYMRASAAEEKKASS